MRKHAPLLSLELKSGTFSTSQITTGLLLRRQWPPHTLITGLEVKEGRRGRGYARLLCEHVIAQFGECGETWVLASVDNFDAVGLYLRSDFKIHDQLWDLDLHVRDSLVITLAG